MNKIDPINDWKKNVLHLFAKSYFNENSINKKQTEFN